MSTPVVSVLVAARNAAPYLDEALQSIVWQQLRDMEIIVVDDASTDSTSSLIARWAADDSRVVALHNERQRGLAGSLNVGLGHVRGPYIARLDADDVALPGRFARQMSMLEADTRRVIVGSNVEYMDGAGVPLGLSDFPLDDWTIRCTALFQCPFVHPTVMMLAEPFRSGGLRYDESFETTQDWELWTRLLDVGHGANAPEPLVRQRRHAQAISATRQDTQVQNSVRVQAAYARRIVAGARVEPERLELLTRAFVLGERRLVDAAGLDRVEACNTALELLLELKRLHPERDFAAIDRRLVRRAVQVGVAPPTRPGWLRLLLRLAGTHPVCLAQSMLAFAVARLGRGRQPDAAPGGQGA